MQAILAALTACPKDADVQRWGCQALVPLFSEPTVATFHHDAGVTAVLRAFAMLQSVEADLKCMGTLATQGKTRGKKHGVVGAGAAIGRSPAAREKWALAMKKVGPRYYQKMLCLIGEAYVFDLEAVCISPTFPGRIRNQTKKNMEEKESTAS